MLAPPFYPRAVHSRANLAILDILRPLHREFMIQPNGITFFDREVHLYWLLKGVGERIDLNWMSIAPGRRDFPAGTEGSHTSEDENTCFAEVQVRRDAPPPRTYLFRLKGTLRSAD